MSSWRYRLFLILAAGGAFYAFFSYYVDMDDFFITMRYANNIAAGKGWVFNPGERVLGTTTPLFTLMITAFVWLGVPAIVAVRVLCSVFLFGTSVMCYKYCRNKEQENIGFAAGLLFCLLLPFKQLWGNEIPLCFFLLLGSLYFFDRQKWALSAVFQCLYALTRMEGLLFFILCTGILFWRKKKIVWGAMIPFFVIIVPWLIFSALYFGDIFPNTLYAKARQGTRPDIWIRFSAGFLNTLCNLFFNLRSPIPSVFALGGLFTLFRRRHILLLIWCGIHQIGYGILGVPGSYPWYYYPLWLLFPLAMAGGIHVMAQWQKSKVPYLICQIRFFGLLFLLLILSWFQPRWNVFFHGRHVLYQKAAEYIKENFPKGTEMIADEIGIFGYYLPDHVILDTAGLVHRGFSPEAYFRYEYLVQTKKPLVIINCKYLSGQEQKESFWEPLFISLGAGKKARYDVIQLFPGEKIMIRILKRAQYQESALTNQDPPIIETHQYHLLRKERCHGEKGKNYAMS